MSITIPAGERNGRMSVGVNASGLSPDSIYYIPFRINSSSAYEVREEKSTVLYRVHMQNFWASTRAIPNYSHRGIRFNLPLPAGYDSPHTEKGEATDPIGTPSFINKLIHPVTADVVRLYAGDKTRQSRDDLEKEITMWSMRVKINDIDDVIKGLPVSVNLSSWDTEHDWMEIRQKDGDPNFPNTYQIVDDGFGRRFNTFLLCYEYIDPINGAAFLMKEELRILYVEPIR
jgi:hypothetical protein